ncbi:hypothetical protein PENTCL1PPCAC_24315, partial [Pristionchus entomophagus]
MFDGNDAVADAERRDRVADTDDIIATENLEQKKERNDFIDELRRENEQSRTSQFSRACGVCLTEAPPRRAVFTSCGHAVCRACAEKLKANAADEKCDLACPFCRKDGGFVPLFEEKIENASRFSRACRVCFADSPRRRAVFSACGHALCRACAEQLAANAANKQGTLECPFCQKEGGFVPLYED